MPSQPNIKLVNPYAHRKFKEGVPVVIVGKDWKILAHVKKGFDLQQVATNYEANGGVLDGQEFLRDLIREGYLLHHHGTNYELHIESGIPVESETPATGLVMAYNEIT